MRASILKLAQSDLREIHEYLSDVGKNPPKKFRASFEKFVEQISDMPYMYSIYRYVPGYRSAVLVFDYLAFYHVDNVKNVIKIHRVLHGKRNIAPMLKETTEGLNQP